MLRNRVLQQFNFLILPDQAQQILEYIVKIVSAESQSTPPNLERRSEGSCRATNTIRSHYCPGRARGTLLATQSQIESLSESIRKDR